MKAKRTDLKTSQPRSTPNSGLRPLNATLEVGQASRLSSGTNETNDSTDRRDACPTILSTRREFIRFSALAAGTFGLAASGCRVVDAEGPCAEDSPRERKDASRNRRNAKSSSTTRPKIAFNTANLVARFTNYRFELKHWGEQHQKTIAATDAKAWAAICADIARCGFRAIEIWEAHAAPEVMTVARAAEWKRILADHALDPIAYAGRLRRESVQICQWLGIPHIDGNICGLAPDAATQLCRESGIRFNTENHPEKTVEQILAPIGGGNEWLGVCVDTGWLGTQGAVAPATIRALGPLARHTHIKDVRATGAHETCPLGEGVVNVEGCLRALKDIGYTGVYSWEDEPEDRNPFDSAVRNRRWIEARVS